MNFEGIRLPSVRVSKPVLQRNGSIHSAAASDEFVSDYASDASSSRSGSGYETPLSRLSPVPGRQQRPSQDPDMTLPARPAAVVPAPLNVQERRQLARTLSNFDRLSPPTPGTDDTPYIRFAIEQLTFDEELMGRGRHGSVMSDDESPIYRGVGDRSANVSVNAGHPSQPPQRPFRFPRQGSQPQQSPRRAAPEMLLPADPPRGRHSLDFVPLPLRPTCLSGLVLLTLFMVAGLIASNVYALRNHGLDDYDGNTSARYFVFEYLPALVGMVIILWLFVVQAAIYRTLPYFALSESTPGRNHDRLLQNAPITPANFVLPDLRFFRLGEPVVGTILVIFWLTNWTVPLLGCLYQTQWFTNFETARWRWTTVQGLGWFLMVLYLVLEVALVLCFVRFRSRASALMWDPTCLADLIVLFQRSNILADFDRLEISTAMQDQLQSKFCRLGYWNTSQSSEVFYAVGQASQPVRNLSTRQTDVENEKVHALEGVPGSEAQRYSQASSFGRNLHSPFTRFRWCPWFLRDSIVLAWIIAAILLLLAFLIVSFVNQAVQHGFDPLLDATTRPNGFSPANFLYSFLPGIFGMFLFLIWQPVDVYYRTIQPYVNLSNPKGAPAQRTILQSYGSMLPGLVTLQAFRNRDFKLAWISFVSLVAVPVPILAGGVFTAVLFNNDNDEVRMVASMPGYIALCIFLTVYALSVTAIWPTRKRYLPHSINTIAGNLSFLYASPLLNDAAIRNIRTKSDFVARLDGGGTNTGLTGDGRFVRGMKLEKQTSKNFRYAFGIYTGRDGKEHLGIDRLQRPGSAEMLVGPGTPVRRSK